MGCTTVRSWAAGILGVIRSTCIVFLLPKSFQGTCSRFQWWSRDMEVPPVWGVPTASEGHLGLVSFLRFGHFEIHTGFVAQVLSICIHKYSRIYSNILSDETEIYCYKTCSLFSKKKTSGWSQRCNFKYPGSLVSWVFSVIGVYVCLPSEHPKSICSHGSGFFCLSVFWFVCCFFWLCIWALCPWWGYCVHFALEVGPLPLAFTLHLCKALVTICKIICCFL